jgi:hypothetical protein
VTVFFQGSELDAFNHEVGLGVYIDADTTTAVDPYSRAASIVQSNDAGFLILGDGVSREDVYFHFWTAPSGSSNCRLDRVAFEIKNQADVAVMRLWINDGGLTSCSGEIQFWDGAAWVASGYILQWVSSLNGPLNVIDIHCNIDGTFGMYLDSETIVETTVVWPSTTGFTQLEIHPNRRNRSIAQGIVSDVPCLDSLVWTIPPTVNGTDADGTGDYTDVDELLLDNTDYVELAAPGDKQSFKAAARTLTSDILAVTVAGRLRSSAGGESAKPYLLIGGVRYYGDTFALSTGYLSYQYTWDNNPDTASPWTPSEANDADLEWGWESV